MTVVGDQMTSAEAARQLGIGVRQVERLLGSGELTRVGTVGRVALIDAASVHRLLGRGARRGRPWSTETILAAIELLTDGRTKRLESTQRSRLRSRLRHMDAEDLVRATSGRAEVRRYRASSSFLDRIRQSVTLTGSAAVDARRDVAGRFGLASAQRDAVDGYVDRANVRYLVDRYHLVEDVGGNVTLRVADTWNAVGDVADDVVVALDLAESLDVRERSAGLALLRTRLAASA